VQTAGGRVRQPPLIQARPTALAQGRQQQAQHHRGATRGRKGDYEEMSDSEMDERCEDGGGVDVIVAFELVWQLHEPGSDECGGGQSMMQLRHPRTSQDISSWMPQVLCRSARTIVEAARHTKPRAGGRRRHSGDGRRCDVFSRPCIG
jgi:hypothetical protein